MTPSGEGAKRLHEALTALQHGDGDRAAAAAAVALELFTTESDRTGAAAAHQVLAIAHFGANRFEEALTHVDMAIPLRESTGDAEGLASLWQERMELCLRTGDLAGARESAEKQVSAAARGTDREAQAHAMHQLSQLLLQTGDDGRAEALVSEALWLLDGPQHARARSAMHLLYANIWLVRGDHDRALGQGKQGLEMARVAKNRAAEVDALHQLGVILAAAGEHGQAVRTLGEALVGRELLKDVEGRAQVLRELATSEAALGQMDDAYGHLRYAARSLRDAGNPMGEITMLQLILEMAENAGNSDVTVEAARAMVDAADRTGDAEAGAGARFHLATRLVTAGELVEAGKQFRGAAEAQRALGLAHEAAVSVGMLGQVLVATGQREEGVALLRGALAELEAVGSEAAGMVREILAEVGA